MEQTKRKKSIGVVIPCHNRKMLTLKSVASLLAISHGLFQLHIYVVDDGSTDGTRQALRQLDHSAVTLLEGDGTLFWTGGVNLGVKRALADNHPLILLMNDDIIFEANFLKVLYQQHLYSPDAIIAAITKDKSDHRKVLRAGAVRDTASAPYFRATVKEYARHFTFTQAYEVEWASARAMLIPSRIFISAGIFDQHKFPHALADLEFCIRAKSAGYKILINPDSVIYTTVEPKFTNHILKQKRYEAVRDLWLDNRFFGIRLIYHFSAVFQAGRFGFVFYYVLMYIKWSFLKLFTSERYLRKHIAKRQLRSEKAMSVKRKI